MMRWPYMLFVLFAFALNLSARAESPAPAGRFFLVPFNMVERSPGVLHVRHASSPIAYIDGLGWLPYGPDIPPIIEDGRVYVSEAVIEAIAPTLPRLVGVRVSESDSVRVVLDLAGLPDPQALEALRQEGRLEDQGWARVPLPDLLVPRELAERLTDSDVVDLLLEDGAQLRLVIAGSGLVYRAFALEAPRRVVVDLDFVRFAEVEEETRQLQAGLRYRRFAAPTSLGSSGVHLLEISPGYGRFRVIGESARARPLSQLARDHSVAINAGYFDTRTAAAIGLLRIDHATQSWPFPGRGAASYLGRATVGFSGNPGRQEVSIDRVRSAITLRLGGQPYPLNLLQRQGEVRLHTQPGQEAGWPSGRALVVSNGRVHHNAEGVVHVPPGGFVIAYAASVAALRGVRAGAYASLETSLSPEDFDTLPDAVEAGPLLVQGGQPAYLPDGEAFVGDLLTKRTDRSAIGVKADGTVLLVTADNMTGRELVTLFLALGADSAMNLDGGGSTTLVVAGEVLNRRFERPVVSAIVWDPAPSSAR